MTDVEISPNINTSDVDPFNEDEVNERSSAILLETCWKLTRLAPFRLELLFFSTFISDKSIII